MLSKEVLALIMKALREAADKDTDQIDQNTSAKVEEEIQHSLFNLCVEGLVPESIGKQPIANLVRVEITDKPNYNLVDPTKLPCSVKISAVGILGAYIKNLQGAAELEHAELMAQTYADYELALFDA